MVTSEKALEPRKNILANVTRPTKNAFAFQLQGTILGKILS